MLVGHHETFDLRLRLFFIVYLFFLWFFFFLDSALIFTP